ncbi:MAG: hypothetical protein AAF701_06455 [Pseudomonadota bacterium]
MNKCRVVFVFSLIPVLWACSSERLWYKEGAAPTRIDRQLTSCQVSALDKVPVNTQINTTPTYRVPVETACDTRKQGEKTCHTTEYETRGGDVYSYDANTELRERVVAHCMGDLGYTQIELPYCESQMARIKAQGQTRFPRLTDTSCVVDVAGHIRIVNE